MYNQPFFRRFLLSESTRAERSGYSFSLLLVYSTGTRGLVVPMDRDVADTVDKALFRTLRETDYVGWYIDRRIVGGVLTVLAQDSAVKAGGLIQQRLMDILRVEVSAEKNSRLQIRVYQQHELEGDESLEGVFTVN